MVTRNNYLLFSVSKDALVVKQSSNYTILNWERRKFSDTWGGNQSFPSGPDPKNAYLRIRGTNYNRADAGAWILKSWSRAAIKRERYESIIYPNIDNKRLIYDNKLGIQYKNFGFNA